MGKRSVQLSRSVVSDSLRPHESQHTGPPYPSPTPGVHSDSHPSSQWCHPAISSSIVPFSSCPQSLPASESFPMSQLFPWGAQSTGVSASASLPPKKSQGWSPEGSLLYSVKNLWNKSTTNIVWFHFNVEFKNKTNEQKKQIYRCREHIGGFQSNVGCGVDKMSKRG